MILGLGLGLGFQPVRGASQGERRPMSKYLFIDGGFLDALFKKTLTAFPTTLDCRPKADPSMPLNFDIFSRSKNIPPSCERFLVHRRQCSEGGGLIEPHRAPIFSHAGSTVEFKQMRYKIGMNLQRGVLRANVLDIRNDSREGLIKFEHAETPEWCHAAQLAQLGWSVVAS
jgi:hypothetical protein